MESKCDKKKKKLREHTKKEQIYIDRYKCARKILNAQRNCTEIEKEKEERTDLLGTSPRKHKKDVGLKRKNKEEKSL